MKTPVTPLLLLVGISIAALGFCVSSQHADERFVALANVVEGNVHVKRALEDCGIEYRVMRSAGIDCFFVKARFAAPAKRALIANWKKHGYCMTVSQGRERWQHFNGGHADPKTYAHAYSQAFLDERSEAMGRRGR